jgi:hypothetical protein
MSRAFVEGVKSDLHHALVGVPHTRYLRYPLANKAGYSHRDLESESLYIETH